MKQGQDLGCAAPDVFVRLEGGLAARLPGHAGMGHGLKRPRLVRAPDREPKLSAQRVGPLDQPLFTAASGSLTRTTQGSRMKVYDPMLGADFGELAAPEPCLAGQKTRPQ